MIILIWILLAVVVIGVVWCFSAWLYFNKYAFTAKEPNKFILFPLYVLNKLSK